MNKSKKQEQLLIYLNNDILLVENKKNPFSKLKNINTVRQNENDFMEYTGSERIIYRERKNDRIIPISTTILNEYNQKNDSKIERTELHYGPNSDELARSYHANALVIGTAIYFRNGAYKPETEDGRKILAHELTHVKQNLEDILEGQKTVRELEAEAEQIEKQTVSVQKDYRYLNYDGNRIRVNKNLYTKIMEMVKENIESKIEHNLMHLKEEDYFKFLLTYEKMESRGELIWQK